MRGFWETGTRQQKWSCCGLGGYSMSSYNKLLFMNRPKHTTGHWESQVHGKGRCTKLCVLSLMYSAAEGLNQKRATVVFIPGRHSAGPFKLPRWEAGDVCQSSPRLQPLCGGSAKCSRVQSQLGFTRKKDPSPPQPTWWLLLNTTLCHNSGTIYFLERRANISLHRKDGSTTSLQVTGCAFFDIACALQAWTPSKCCPSRISCLGRWDCPHAGEWSISWCVVCYSSCTAWCLQGPGKFSECGRGS